QFDLPLLVTHAVGSYQPRLIDDPPCQSHLAAVSQNIFDIDGHSRRRGHLSEKPPAIRTIRQIGRASGTQDDVATRADDDAAVLNIRREQISAIMKGMNRP